MEPAVTAPTPVWTLQSTLWLSDEEVELYLTGSDGGDALVRVEVRVNYPATPCEQVYREDLVVLDIEGEPIAADDEVERSRELILREFYAGKSIGRA
jgi:hypothetical protein